MSLLVTICNFKFVTEAYNEHHNTEVALLYAIQFLLETVTTLGTGQVKPVQLENYLYTMVLQLMGVILYGYVFKQMLHFIKKAKTVEYSKRERKDDLEAWLINREKRRTVLDSDSKFLKKADKLNGYSSVILKTKKAFEYIWQWDIQGIFGNELFRILTPQE